MLILPQTLVFQVLSYICIVNGRIRTPRLSSSLPIPDVAQMAMKAYPTDEESWARDTEECGWWMWMGASVSPDSTSQIFFMLTVGQKLVESEVRERVWRVSPGEFDFSGKLGATEKGAHLTARNESLAKQREFRHTIFGKPGCIELPNAYSALIHRPYIHLYIVGFSRLLPNCSPE